MVPIFNFYEFAFDSLCLQNKFSFCVVNLCFMGAVLAVYANFIKTSIFFLIKPKTSILFLVKPLKSKIEQMPIQC